MPFDLQSRSRHGINYTYPQLFPVSGADVHSGLVDEVQMTSLMGGCKANYAGRTKSIGRRAFYKQTDTIHHFLATPAPSDNNQLETCRKSSLLTGSISTPVSINFTYNHKVVPKSVVNPDCLKPLNCKGLFTTTHARTNRPLISPILMKFGGHQATCSIQSIRVDFDRLPDRNLEPGLIGIGLASGLRTLFYEN
jgi:hypothetical protein